MTYPVLSVKNLKIGKFFRKANSSYSNLGVNEVLKVCWSDSSLRKEVTSAKNSILKKSDLSDFVRSRQP